MSKYNQTFYTPDEIIFKDFRMISPIGEGGFGRVYLVENAAGKPHALKVVFKDVHLEQRGVEDISKIQSEHLINVMDYGETVSCGFLRK